MAKIIKKPSALKSDYLRIKRSVRRALLTSLLLVLTSVLGSVIMQKEEWFTAGLIITSVSVLGFLICIAITISKQSNLAVKKQGVLGEEATAELLSRKLSDDYTVFQNCVISFNGKSSETDLIVIGNNGIFIIEAKNRNGRIEGNYGKDRWIQHKTGYKGGSYSAEFYSPVKQVGTHIFRLAGFLRQNGIRAHIDGAVFFINPDTEPEITGKAGDIPVFYKEKDLLRFIKKNDNPISTDIQRKICELLN